MRPQQVMVETVDLEVRVEEMEFNRALTLEVLVVLMAAEVVEMLHEVQVVQVPQILVEVRFLLV